MAIIWITCGLMYWWKNEKRKTTSKQNLYANWPYVTILIPCHNEERIITNTCKKLLKIDYPKYRVIFIDDASNDNTSKLIRKWLNLTSNFHLLRLEENQGKSNALNSALAVAGSTPITVIMDADTLPHPASIKILVKELMSSHDVGAVTGHPIVENRNNILEKLQTIEFTSIIGLIKRAQNLYGHIFSISGCIAAFKTDALFKVGGFSTITATEDIDITWRLQKAFYRVVYIPQAIVYIQVPNKFSEFWKQRKRWALGGWHLLRTHKDVLLKWKWRRLWPIYIEVLLSYIWSILFILGVITWIVANRILLLEELGISPLPSYTSILILICLIQFVVSIKLNYQYDKKLWKLFFLIIWYPFLYFCIGALSVCRTAAKGVFQDMDSAGKWKSPARVKLKN
ncbi:MAG: glycosyltransferase family 2 protein [Vulcanibacillus sp.]